MKGGKYTKPLAKNQVRRIFRIRDIRRNVLLAQIYRDLYGDVMLVPTWMGTNKNICYRILVQKREFFPQGTHKH